MTTQELQTVARTINEIRTTAASYVEELLLNRLSVRLGETCVPPVELDQFLATCGCRKRQATA